MKNNKGFSLVELIIVIAIMAILVAVMAPQLIKYVEKSKVSSDISMLNALEVAFAYGISDPSVNDDPDSIDLIDDLINGVKSLDDIETNYSGTTLYAVVIDTLGWDDLSYTTYMKYVKSAHSSSSDIFITYYHDINNPVKIWIDNTDITGAMDTSTSLGAVIPSASNKATYEKLVHIGEIYQ